MTTSTLLCAVKKFLITALLPSLALFATLTLTAAPVWADSQIAFIAVGAGPNDVAVNSATNKWYVMNADSANVTVIDGATLTATATIAVGASPTDVEVNPVTNKIYVASFSSNTVTVIDGATNSTTTIAVGINPGRIAVNPVTNKVYVTNGGFNTNSVTVIDGATNTTTTVAVGISPQEIAVNLVTNKIYVANFGFNGIGTSVTVIDGATNATTTFAVTAYSGSVGMGGIEVNPVTNKIYVAFGEANDGTYVAVIDGATNATTKVAVASGSRDIAVNPVTNKVYVASGSLNTVTVIDGATNVTTSIVVGSALPPGIGENPGSLTIGVNPVTNKIYTGHRFNVTMIDGVTNSAATVFGGGNANTALDINPVTNRVYVVTRFTNIVWVIAPSTVSAITVTPANPTINVGQTQPFTAAGTFSDGSSFVEVIWGSSNVSVATISPTGIATGINPGTTTITATSGSISGSTTLLVVSSNHPPVANAGLDQTIEATGPAGAAVSLNGAGSTDPDGDTLIYLWSGSFGLVSGINPTVSLPLGTHTVTLTVSDDFDSATDTVVITVRDTTAPIIAAHPDITAEATTAAGAVVSYISPTTTDAVDGAGVAICTPASGSTFAIGTVAVACSATDAAGNSSSATFNVTVQDTPPPVIISVSKAGTGSGTVTSSPTGINCGATCSALFDTGTVVTLTATANSGSVFAGWSGDPDCLDGAVTLNADKTCTATFDLSTSATKLINISTRAFVGTGSNAAVGGFIISGTGNKQVLIRGFGPTLSDFGISGALANPTLDLFWDDDNNPNTSGILVLSNNDWGMDPTSCPAPIVSCGTSVEIANTGMSADSYAPANPDRGLDAALLLTLPPGTYTATLRGVSNGTGVGLIGVDDVDTNQTAKLINISTRAFVGTGSDAAVGGFIISGTGNKQVLIRGFGPTLADFGISGALANPTLDLYWDDDNNPNTSGILVLSNDDWGTDPTSCPAPVVSCGTSVEIANTGMSADSYAPTNPNRGLDAALLLTLPPGTYTATLRGVSNGTGVGLIGVDEIDP